MLMVLPVKHHKLSPIKVKKAFTLSNRITINCEPKFKKVTIKPNLFPNRKSIPPMNAPTAKTVINIRLMSIVLYLLV